MFLIYENSFTLQQNYEYTDKKIPLFYKMIIWIFLAASPPLDHVVVSGWTSGRYLLRQNVPKIESAFGIVRTDPEALLVKPVEHLRANTGFKCALLVGLLGRDESSSNVGWDLVGKTGFCRKTHKKPFPLNLSGLQVLFKRQ